ncbi:MAG: class I SAM-dependent methyltransferase [Elusimicrobiota bacterium]|jgi:ubiquinone/menaquinone biosynthesis C-methylase UbiE
MNLRQNGDIRAFKANWVGRAETKNNYFSRRKPLTQIQLAFQQHWSFIREVIGIPKKGKSLEVGCGRGSISSFFAEAGYRVTLFDLSSEVLETAKEIYAKNNHLNRAEFVAGNALKMPFQDNTFDVVISIGLLEHFRSMHQLLSEQVRVLKPGGVFIAYVVPKKKSVQTFFQPINNLLKTWLPSEGAGLPKKHTLFRTTYGSEFYKRHLRKLPVRHIQSCGVYPFPAISPSPRFPFTLLPPAYEKALTEVYDGLLRERARQNPHPWACSESWGQTFFLWAKKR